MELFWTQITDAQPARPARTKAHGSAWGVSLLAYAVRAVWGIALPETAELPGGKPYFPACPQLHFSVSHTRTAALVAVSAAPVGADVEQVRPLHPAMARRLAQADCGDLQPFELWTLRESWFKLTGAGDLRTIPFRRAAGVLVPPEAGALLCGKRLAQSTGTRAPRSARMSMSLAWFMVMTSAGRPSITERACLLDPPKDI